MNYAAPDLTRHPPRSPRVRLGGYVMLPRLLDKCRATLNGTQGEYNYDCPMDQNFLQFTGLSADALKAQVASGKGDAEILAWINEQAAQKRSPVEISQWSAFMEQRAPMDVEFRGFYQEEHQRIAPQREDISTWFDLLDLDDFFSFGGKP